MKHAVCVLAIVVLLWPALATADTVTVDVLIASIKESPSVQSRSIAQVRRGTKLEVLEKVRSWYKVRLSDARTGWVFENSVALVEEKPKKEEDLFGELKDEQRIRVSEATSASSIRGISRPAQVYARNENLDERYVRAVDAMQAYAVTVEEVDQFLREGQVGGR